MIVVWWLGWVVLWLLILVAEIVRVTVWLLLWAAYLLGRWVSVTLAARRR